MPKLTDLDARFVGRAKGDKSFFEFEPTHPFDQEVQGVLFYCPVSGHSHAIVVWFADRGVPPEMTPKTRWQAMGRDIASLTISPSINLDVPWKHPETGVEYPASCKWHGFVVNGEAKP